LKDKGYDAGYVDQVTNWLMFQLQKQNPVS